MGRVLVNFRKGRPSARFSNVTCILTTAAEYSNPATLKAAAGAMPAFKLAASPAVNSKMSISALRGSPNAD